MSEHQSLVSSRLLEHTRGLRVFAFLALAITACGPSTSTGDPGGGGAAGGSGGAGAGQTTAQGGSGGQATTTGQGGDGGGTPQSNPQCRRSCSVVADCVPPGAAPFSDEDNFACEGEVCEYLGCNADSECVDGYGAGWKCALFPGGLVKQCHLPCTSVNDCFTPNGPPSYDADNYACEDTLCVYKGCNSDAECVDSAGAGWKCEIHPRGLVPQCHLPCSSASDCAPSNAPPSADADNFTCESGFCIYKGCNSTQECVDAYGSDFVCSEGP